VSSGVIAMAVIGIVSCAFIFYLTQKYSHEKVNHCAHDLLSIGRDLTCVFGVHFLG
jgi:hypothetical protein